MEIETLKRSHIKRNIIIGVVAVLIISAIILNFTRAKYRSVASVPIVNSTVNYELSDLNTVAVYIQEGEDYTKTDTIPEEGYTLNQEKSYCKVNDSDINATINYDTNTKTLSVSPLTTKGTKCYLYFDEESNAGEQILANYLTKTTRSSFTSTVTASSTGTIYYADTSKGRTYYFAGNPTDNWVRFAGFYWRIVRINEDGSIRLIYNGTGTGTTGTSTQIQTSAFNSSYNNNMYVGYMYQSNQVHGLTTDSTIKIELDQWYEENLQSHADKISTEAGFCGDRTSTTSSSGAPNDTGGTGTTQTYYGARYRLNTNKTPTFECPDADHDLYTVSSANSGNKALDYPIGLITADEVAYAGGVVGQSNNGYYLYTNQYYWTMSPCGFNGSYAGVFSVGSDGSLDNVNGVYWTEPGVRPIINLAPNVIITGGNGAVDSPFEIAA